MSHQAPVKGVLSVQWNRRPGHSTWSMIHEDLVALNGMVTKDTNACRSPARTRFFGTQVHQHRPQRAKPWAAAPCSTLQQHQHPGSELPKLEVRNLKSSSDRIYHVVQHRVDHQALDQAIELISPDSSEMRKSETAPRHWSSVLVAVPSHLPHPPQST